MSIQSAPVVKMTSKPTVAGILNIIVGASCLLSALGLGIGAAIFGPWMGFPFYIPGIFLGLLAIPALLLGALILVSGMFAIQRRRWGWALAGTIAVLIVSGILGIISTILIALSKDEFKA